ncbi:MAG TPA: winged helix DNA-binding protein [Candidatus Borkfalkia faecavium]|uniref:Winged helix DNA-binding protein n=1 Tax=Candidatus Borkfalkia faecavium TaxID=2838508 RepID=A0A9D1W2B8_9FIRM|nr:winged helix DNA-binding protein [Candidatus Borkfalkia faecavium]
MDKTQLRDGLMRELRRMTKLDIIAGLREFVEGEIAALYCLNEAEGALAPSQLSEELKVSRARTANILRSLRGKGFVEMDISAGDRRKMDVRCTEAGRAFLEEKYTAVLRLFEAYVDALGEEDILQLTRILDKIVSYEEQVQAKTNRGGAER